MRCLPAGERIVRCQPQGWLRDLRRLPGWEAHLTGLIRRSRQRPFEWGAFDCVTFAADAVVAVAGFDPFLAWRGRYRDIAGATGLAAVAGEDLLMGASRHLTWLGVPEGNAASARDGDIGAWQGPRSAVMGVYVSRFLALPGTKGLCYLPREEACAAWRIG